MNKEENNTMMNFKIKLINNNNKNSNHSNKKKNSLMLLKKVKKITIKNIKIKRIINIFRIEISMMV